MKPGYGPNINKLISKKFLGILGRHYGSNLNILQAVRSKTFDLRKFVEEAEKETQSLLEELRVMRGNPYGDDMEALAGHVVAEFEAFEGF